MAAKRKWRVVVIEDHDDSRALIESLLAGSEFEVLTAVADAESALPAIRSSSPDLVLTDLSLPDVSGEQLAATLRSQVSGALRIVAITGRDVARDEAQLFDRIIAKPFQPSRVLSLLRELVGSAPASENTSAPTVVECAPGYDKPPLSEAECRALLELAPVMLWRAAADASCDWFNDTWLAFTGRGFEEERGDGWAKGVHPEDLQRCFDEYLFHFKQRIPFQLQYRLRRFDGAYRWVTSRAVPYFADDGSFAGFIGACTDLEERRSSSRAPARALKRLLLVDDDPDVLDALSGVLEDDFEIVTAPDGEVALERLNNEHYDVVLLDMMMPVVDGEGVVQAARAAGLRTPILLGSALPDLRDEANRLQLPSVSKPYDLPRLIAKLHELAEQSAA